MALTFIFIPVPLHCLSTVLFSLVVCYTIYSSDLTNSSDYATQAKSAERILQKMNQIKPEDVKSKIEAMGLHFEDVHPELLKNNNEKLRQLIAKYESILESNEKAQILTKKECYLEGFIDQQLELKWKKAGYKIPFDIGYVKIHADKFILCPPNEKKTVVEADSLRRVSWKLLQHHRLHMAYVNERIALIKLNAAFILKLIQNPYEKDIDQYITGFSPDLSLATHRMVAYKFHEKDTDVIVTTIKDSDNNNKVKKYTEQDIDSRTPVQLAKEIFGLKTSSWLPW